LVDDEGEIVRLLEALSALDRAKVSGRSTGSDEANWVSRALRWGADMGLSPDVSTLILSETLSEICAALSPASNARGPKRGRAEDCAFKFSQVSRVPKRRIGAGILTSISQIRAARSLLRWTQSRLAQAAGLSVQTVKRFETGRGAINSEAAEAKMVAALEVAGIELIPETAGGPGVKMKRKPEVPQGVRTG
jgi:DNA-binding XRE family transcriptional regulator